MGTSRGPVREAIRQLEQEGLVEHFSHRGATVTGVPEAELAGVNELRAVIEARGFVDAARFVNQVDLDELGGIADAYELAEQAADLERVVDLNHQFHSYVLGLSRLVVLRRIWDGLDGFLRVDMYQRIDRPEQVLVDATGTAIPTHHDLIAALDTRDRIHLRDAIVRHVLQGPWPV
jgi:DNA-binding GntR family transcriptional regulator